MGIHSDSFPPRLSTPKLQKIYTITQMDKAKAAVGSFLHKDGKHDTTVHETVNPAVTQENVTRTQHENVTTAVDREVHQDHHHTSVQPIKDREVLPEQHNHQMAGVETRNLKHGNDEHVKERLAAEQAQFKCSYCRRYPTHLFCQSNHCWRARPPPRPLNNTKQDKFMFSQGELDKKTIKKLEKLREKPVFLKEI